MLEKEKILRKVTDTTYNPLCPDCRAMRMHLNENWNEYHPHNREGFSKEHGVPKPK